MPLKPWTSNVHPKPYESLTIMLNNLMVAPPPGNKMLAPQKNKYKIMRLLAIYFIFILNSFFQKTNLF